MRIALCDYSGHPFQVELSRCLARRGHEVLHLHFADFQTPKGSLRHLPGDPPGFAVEGLRLGATFDKRQFLRRRFWEAKVGALTAARCAAFGAEIIVGCNMPLDAQRVLCRAARRQQARFVFWLQDVYSHAIRHYLSARLGLVGRAIGSHYQRLEGRLLRASDAVVAISEKFRPPLEAWGVARERVRVIPNWAPLSEIYPTPKDNAWARAHGLQDKLVALYTGTLGLKHDPALLLDLARAGAGVGLHVVVVSEGAAAQWLAEQQRQQAVANLRVLPFQPMEAYPEVLGAGDILLAMVGEEAAAFSVPSKILSYLAAGKPIIASIAANNDAAATIAAAEAGMIAVPGDSKGFCAAVQHLARDSALRHRLGRNARKFAETRFESDAIADRFEQLFATIARPAPRDTRRAATELG
jgi:colanic acid biosynthesis glycosyl transferase WcaI